MSVFIKMEFEGVYSMKKLIALLLIVVVAIGTAGCVTEIGEHAHFNPNGTKIICDFGEDANFANTNPRIT